MFRTRITLLTASLLLVLLVGCKQDASSPDTTGAASGMQAVVEQAEADAQENGAVAAGDAALKPNERVQGTIQLDVGDGATAFRSIATKIADDLGKTTAARMGTAEGQKDLAGANAKVGGGRTNVSAQDVQDIANAFAGKTVYTSQMHSLSIANLRQVELSGVAADGRKTSLNINFPMDSDTPNGASLSYYPDGKKRTQWFETKRKSDDGVQVTLDRFERLDDKTLSIAGSFKAAKLTPGVMAKDLVGQEVNNVSGSFDFTEVNIRPEK